MMSTSLFADKWLALGAGVCGIVRPKDRTAMVQIEYQPKPLTQPVSWFDVRPQLGFFINFKAATYIYGGFRFEFLLGKHLLVTPGFAPGLYIKGHGKRLHFPIEYKSSFELAWQYKQGSRRIGAQFYHISNASIGFHNPGTEMLVFTYSFRL
jgi:lipid A 3-O-deacylase